MPTNYSTLTFYKKSKLDIERNFIVESIDDYLSTLQSDVVDNYQWQRITLEKSIKVDMNQSAIDELNPQYNYLKIENSDVYGFKAYYFITRWTQISENTIQFELLLDTLNTYNSQLQFDKRTKIIREHKNRVSKNVNIGFYDRIIDRINENINPQLHGKDIQIFNDTIEDCAYLIFDSDPEDAQEPVKTYLCFDTQYYVETNSSDFTITPTDLSTGQTYYFLNVINEKVVPYGIFEASSRTFNSGSGFNYDDVISIKKNASNTIDIVIARYRPNGNYVKTIAQVGNISTIKVLNATTKLNSYYSTRTFQQNLKTTIEENHKQSFISTTSSHLLNSIKQVDRTKPTLNKIIKLPYCPTDIEINNNIIKMADSWSFDSSTSLLKFNTSTNLGAFKRNISFEFEDSNPLNISIFYKSSIQVGDARNDLFESKIYNSEFYQPKFVYDSFGYIFKMENYRNFINSNLNVQYSVSSLLNSKFMFQFTDFYTENFDDNDYNDILMISRNNEVMIYNSSYLNYINNGYNFDQKLKAIQTFENVASGVVNTTRSLASGEFVGGVSSAVGTILSQAKTEIGMEQKIAQLKAQSVNVASSDDLDLLDVYSYNKAKMKLYEPSTIMKQMILDLFFYYGYATNELKIPSTKTRTWFNFLQCDAVFKVNNYYSKLADNIKENIHNKFLNGVIYLHKNEISGSNKWDFEQEYENYERNII